MVNYILQLEKLLKNSFKNIKGQSCGLLFSGGVDSSLTAKLAILCGLKPTLLSLKTEKAKDVEHIKKTAKLLNLPLVFVNVDSKKIKEDLSKIKNILQELKIEQNLMQLSLGLSMYFLAEKAKKLGFKICFCGQGADELFAGYHKFQDLRTKELKRKVKIELERLRRVDKVRDEGIFKKFGVRLFSPFLDEKVVKFSLDLPVKLLKNEKENKIIVRRLARKLGLPSFVYQKPKKALQYSSGIQKLVKKALKSVRLEKFKS